MDGLLVGSGVIDATRPRPGGGLASARYGPTGGVTSWFKAPNSGNHYFRFYVFTEAWPLSGSCQLMHANTNASRTGSASSLYIRLDSTGLLEFAHGNPLTAIAGSAQLSLSTWHRVELFYRSSGGTQGHELRVDGATISSTAAAAWGAGAANTHTFIGHALSGTVTVNIDDFAWNDGTGTANNSWPGDGTIILVKPKRDTAIGSWTTDTAAASTTNLWEGVNNTPPVGIADTTASATAHQIRNVSGTLPQRYDVLCQTYAAAGVPGNVSQTDITGTDAAVGDASARTSVAQSFLMNGTLASVDLNVATSGSPADALVVELHDDVAGVPDAPILSSATVDPSLVSGTTAWLNVQLPDYGLTQGVTYWLVVTRAGAVDAANYYKLKRRAAGATNYEDGVFASYDGATWTTDSTVDLAFRLLSSQGFAPIAVLQPQVCHGEGSGTGTKTGTIELLANPATAAATFTYGDDVGAASTFPTNWRWALGTNAGQPGGLANVGVGPSIRLAKTDVGTSAALACFLGVWVDVGPAPTAGQYASSSWLKYTKTSDSSSWWAKQAVDRTTFLYDIGAGEVAVVVDPGDFAVRADPIDATAAVTDIDEVTFRAGYSMVNPQP